MQLTVIGQFKEIIAWLTENVGPANITGTLREFTGQHWQLSVMKPKHSLEFFIKTGRTELYKITINDPALALQMLLTFQTMTDS